MSVTKSVRGAISKTGLLLLVFRFGVSFIFLSALLFLLGFATNHWHKDPSMNYGLWELCQNGACKDLSLSTQPAYHIATSILQILAGVAYFLGPLIHFIFYCLKRTSKDFRTRILDIAYSIGSMFHFISVLVFGLVHPGPEFLSWSYNMSAAGLGLAAVGVILIIISRKTATKVFLKRIHWSSGRRTLPFNSVQPSGPGTPQSTTSQKNPFQPQLHHHIQAQGSSNTYVSCTPNQPGTVFRTTLSCKPFLGHYRPTPSGPTTEAFVSTKTNNLHSSHLHSNHSATISTELPTLQAVPLNIEVTQSLQHVENNAYDNL